MPDKNECLQLTHGPTPCFREGGYTICDLPYCEATAYLQASPSATPWFALNHHCPVTHPFDYRGKNRSIQIKVIASLK